MTADREERWARTVQVDDDGNTIEVALATVDELRRAHAFHCEAADRLRHQASMRQKRDSVRDVWLDEAHLHDRVAARLYSIIAAQGERL